MILGARRSRIVGGIWILVGLAFLAAGLILWFDTGRVWFEFPAAVVAFVFAVAWWRQRAVLDRHGIRTLHAFREDRLLWAGIDPVEIRRPSWFRPALVLHPKGGRPAITVPASAGLRRQQRDRLLELLTDLSHQHGFVLVTPMGATSDDRPAPLPARGVPHDAGPVTTRGARAHLVTPVPDDAPSEESLDVGSPRATPTRPEGAQRPTWLALLDPSESMPVAPDPGADQARPATDGTERDEDAVDRECEAPLF